MEKYLNFIKFGRVCFQDAMILNTIVAIPHILVVAYAKSGIALQHLKKWFDENYIEEYYRSNKITKKVYEAIKNRM